MPREKLVVNSEELVVSRMCEIIQKLAEEAVIERDQFVIAVSGGSVVNMLARGLPQIKTSWSKWKVIFCDERLVPADDQESTFGLYKSSLIPVCPLTEQQFASINFALADNPVDNAGKAASEYEKKLKDIFPESSLYHDAGKNKSYPMLDCAILGMGPDGHTCSLFPGDTASLEADSWVIPITNSPKPPPCRVTLTVPVLQCARFIIFPMSGSSKASTIKSVLCDENKNLPASLVNPTMGSVLWILDEQAASQL